MSAGKLTSALIQKSFTTQHKSPNCTKSTNAGLVDFSKGTVTFCSSFTPTGLLKITSAVGEKSPYGQRFCSSSCSSPGALCITRLLLNRTADLCPSREAHSSCSVKNSLRFNIFLKGIWTCRLWSRASVAPVF